MITMLTNTIYTQDSRLSKDYTFVHSAISGCKNFLQIDSAYRLIDLFYRKHFDFDLRCNLIALLKLKTKQLDKEDKIKRPQIKNYKSICGEGAFHYVTDVNKYINYLENKLKL